MVKILLLIAYIFIGIVVASAIKEDWENISIFDIIFFPLILGGIVVFKIIEIAVNIGEKINEMIENKR